MNEYLYEERLEKLKKFRQFFLMITCFLSIPLAGIGYGISFIYVLLGLAISDGSQPVHNRIVDWIYNDNSFVTDLFQKLYNAVLNPMMNNILSSVGEKTSSSFLYTVVNMQLGLFDMFIKAFCHNAVIMLLIPLLVKGVPFIITWRNVQHHKKTLQRWKENSGKR